MNDWEKKRKAALERNLKSWKAMTEQQQEAVQQAKQALMEFISDFSDTFDVSTTTARDLDRAYWKLNASFSFPEDKK